MAKQNMQINTDTKIEQMFRAGAHYGYSKSRRHASTAPYIFNTKNGVDIINIEKSFDLFNSAIELVKNLAASGKVLMFIGTKSEAKKQVTEAALALNMPYVSERWVGGTLTNFPEIKKRVTKLLDWRSQKEKGEFEKYTKKERLMIEREMDKMTKNFQGITGMPKVPDYVFVIDPKKEHLAVTEARKMNIPVIAISNTDCNIKLVNYPILANDSSVSSISFFVSNIKEAYEQGSLGKK